jgi:hypothetical protein
MKCFTSLVLASEWHHRVIRAHAGGLACRFMSASVRKRPSPLLLRRQLLQQRLRLLEVTRIEPFGKPAVDRSEQFASLLRLALGAPEPSHAHRGAEFPGFSLLLARDCKRQPDFKSFARWIFVPTEI